LSAKSYIKILKEIDMTRIRILVISILVLMALSASTLFAEEKDTVRAKDRVAIEQLMWDYIRALDSGNAEAYAALFAPDGQFGRGAKAVKGREALIKMMNDAGKQLEAAKKSGQKMERMNHVLTNTHIEFVNDDHARFYAYWMGVFTSGKVTSAGREVNELVKIDGKWLISVRDVDPKE
jgi:uncharacterized protein (TIGR02246 family)